MKKTFIFIVFTFFFSVLWSQDVFYAFTKDERSGVINQDGKVVLSPNYNKVEVCKQYFICKKDNKWGVINSKNQTCLPFEYDYISFVNVFLVEKDNKSGIVSEKNKQILPIIYDYIYVCPDGYIVEKDKKSALLDKKGKIIIDFIYDKLGSSFFTNLQGIAYSDNLIVFGQNDKYGYLDKKKKVAIPAQFKSAEPFNRGWATIRVDKYTGIIDVNGNFVIPPDKYNYILNYLNLGEIYLGEKKNEQVDIIPRNGDVIANALPSIFVNASSIGNTIVTKKGKKHGLIDTNGKIIIPEEYDGISPMGDNGLIAVMKNGKWGFVNRNNEVVIDFKFVGYVGSFSNGYAIYFADKFSTMGRYTSQKVGYINEQGVVAIEPRFRGGEDFENNRAKVTLGSKELLINREGKIVFELSDNNMEISIKEVIN